MGCCRATPSIVLLMMAALHRSRYTRASDLYFIFGWYVLAKLLEFLDGQVLAVSHIVSGHSLKHVAAAVAGFVACRMLMRRTLVDGGIRVPSGPGRTAAMDRLRALTFGTVLLLCIGWVLHVGKAIFVPAVFGAVVVYIIVGLADALGRLPGLRRKLPSRLRYLVSLRSSAWSASCSLTW